MIKLLKTPLFIAATLFFCSLPASAHHAVQAQFDVNNIHTFTGLMTKVEFINPHPYFYLDVEGPDGQVVNWEIESVALNALRRMGLVKELRAGLEYTVEYHPARNGESQGLMMAITLPTGNRLLMRNAE